MLDVIYEYFVTFASLRREFTFSHFVFLPQLFFAFQLRETVPLGIHTPLPEAVEIVFRGESCGLTKFYCCASSTEPFSFSTVHTTGGGWFGWWQHCNLRFGSAMRCGNVALRRKRSSPVFIFETRFEGGGGEECKKKKEK